MKLKVRQNIDFTMEEAETIHNFCRILESICRDNLYCSVCIFEDLCPINHLANYGEGVLDLDANAILDRLATGEDRLFGKNKVPDFLTEV